MAGEKNLKVTCSEATFDVKLANLEGKGEPRKVGGKIIHMKPDGSPEYARQNEMGEPVAFFKEKDGKVCETNGQAYYTYDEVIDATAKDGVRKVPKVKAQAVKCFYQAEDGTLIPAHNKQKTELFEIVRWEPAKFYNDRYIVDTFYSLIPSKGKSKNDHQRMLNAKANERGMRKLYEHMMTKGVIGRGILNIVGGVGPDNLGFIRPVPLDNGGWTLEIGIFKQQKRYMWVGTEVEEEVIPDEQEMAIPSIDEI